MKTVLRTLLPILIGFLVLITSCQKDDEDLLYWNQTYCAEPWGNVNNSNFDALKLDVDEYLDEKGIEAIEIEVDEDWSTPEACLACSCLSGVRIEVWVQGDDIDEMKEIGFYQE